MPGLPEPARVRAVGWFGLYFCASNICGYSPKSEGSSEFSDLPTPWTGACETVSVFPAGPQAISLFRLERNDQIRIGCARRADVRPGL